MHRYEIVDLTDTPQFSIQDQELLPGAKVKERGHVATTQRMTEVDPAVKAQVASTYETVNKEELVAEAKAHISRLGLNNAFDEFRRNPPQDVRLGSIGHELSLQLEADGAIAAAAEVRTLIAEHMTSKAQVLWYISTISKTSPEGVQREAEMITKKAARAGGKLTPEIEAALKRLAQLEQELVQARKEHGNGAVVAIEDALRALGLDATKLSDLQVRLREILIQGASNPKDARARLISLLVGQANLSQARAAQMADAALREFTRRAKATRDGVLRQLIQAAYPKTATGRKSPVKRTLFEKWIAMNNAGMLTDETLYAGIAKQYGIPVFTRSMADRIAAQQRAYAAAPEGVVKLWKGMEMMDAVYANVPVDLWTKTATLYKMMKIFSFQVVGRNILGSGFSTAASTLNDGLAGIAGSFGLVPTKPGFYLKARWKGLGEPVRAWKEGLDYARKQKLPGFATAMKTMITASRFYQSGVQNAEQFNSARRSHVFDSWVGRRLEDTLQLMQGTTDLMFYQAAKNASLARSEANARARGDWTGIYTTSMMEQAELDASRITFRDANVFSKSFSKLQEGLNWLTIPISWMTKGKFGAGTSTIPFAQVPGSIMEKAVVTWNPLGLIKGLYQALPSTPAEPEGRSRMLVDTFSRAITATTFGVGLGYLLGKAGIVTAGDDDDPDVRKMKEQHGFGQFMINLTAFWEYLTAGPGAWMSGKARPPQDNDQLANYAWAQPVAMPVVLGAQLAKMEKEGKLKDMQMQKAPQTMWDLAVTGELGAILEQPMMMQLSRFAKEADEDKAKWAMGMISGILDFTPTMLSDIAEAAENIKRETRSGNAWDAAVAQKFARIPGNTLPPRYTTLGQLDERYHKNVLWNALANPIQMKRFRDIPELRFLESIMAETGRTDIAPQLAPKKARIHPDGAARSTEVELTPKQVSDMQRMMGRLTADMLGDHASNPQFAILPAERKADEISRDLATIAKAAKVEILGDSLVHINESRFITQQRMPDLLPMMLKNVRKESVSFDQVVMQYINSARARGYTPQQ